MATSSEAIALYFFPDSPAICSINGVKRSQSKLLNFPCRTAATRSSPIPVSMEGFGNGVIAPDSSRLNCMNTRFHSSRKRSQSQPTAQSGRSQPCSGPRSMWISEQGPQGPVSPMAQKLSASPRRTILPAGKSLISCQSRNASSSSL